MIFSPPQAKIFNIWRFRDDFSFQFCWFFDKFSKFSENIFMTDEKNPPNENICFFFVSNEKNTGVEYPLQSDFPLSHLTTVKFAFRSEFTDVWISVLCFAGSESEILWITDWALLKFWDKMSKPFRRDFLSDLVVEIQNRYWIGLRLSWKFSKIPSIPVSKAHTPLPVSSSCQIDVAYSFANVFSHQILSIWLEKSTFDRFL